jgi:cellulose synthase/poly-beta-1,6-N-acetylglucosamine synthase-like glycosyltransferase
MILTTITWLLWLAVALLALPVLVFSTQILLSLRRSPRPAQSAPGSSQHPTLRVAVLMPAHNESKGITQTLEALMPSLGPHDRVLVVADNCTDATAQLARAAGAEVVERTHLTLRGKGYALDHGMQHLKADPPDVMVIVDADCLVHSQALALLAQQAHASQRPVQALYLMLPAEGAGVKQRIAAWAWRLKNWARPLGWHRLGWPCQLMGTGMAFPWGLATRMDLANGHLAEDMKLGVDLALVGVPPMFCEAALVTSEFPSSEQAQQSQRTRWEHGHLSALLAFTPRLLARALLTRDLRTLGMALDLGVPPVTLLGAALSFFTTCALMHAFAGDCFTPLLAMMALTIYFTLGVWLAWWRWGRDLISSREWLQLPKLLLNKLPLYARFLMNRQKEWVRTDRE